jgi:hypothetical protein
MEVAGTIDDWQVTQQRVFTKWINTNLEGTGLVVKDVFEDLRDGVVLCKLFETLLKDRGVKAPHCNEHPRSRIERLDNVTQALGYLERCGVQTVFLTPLQVVDGDHKLRFCVVFDLLLL